MNHFKLTQRAAALYPAHRRSCHQQLNPPSLRRLWHDDSGQDLIEYALIAALVGLGVLGAMKGLKNSIGNSFNTVGTDLTNSVA